MPLQMLVPGEGLTTIGAKNHFERVVYTEFDVESLGVEVLDSSSGYEGQQEISVENRFDQARQELICSGDV